MHISCKSLWFIEDAGWSLIYWVERYTWGCRKGRGWSSVYNRLCVAGVMIGMELRQLAINGHWRWGKEPGCLMELVYWALLCSAYGILLCFTLKTSAKSSFFSCILWRSACFEGRLPSVVSSCSRSRGKAAWGAQPGLENHDGRRCTKILDCL